MPLRKFIDNSTSISSSLGTLSYLLSKLALSLSSSAATDSKGHKIKKEHNYNIFTNAFKNRIITLACNAHSTKFKNVIRIA